MIREHALLPVVPGREEDFEAAFALARRHIESSRGFRGLTLSRCLERPSTYLLLVEWDTVEDHTEGFRGSPAYDQWRALLHGFYDPFPVVEHFVDVGWSHPDPDHRDPDHPDPDLDRGRRAGTDRGEPDGALGRRDRCTSPSRTHHEGVP